MIAISTLSSTWMVENKLEVMEYIFLLSQILSNKK
jgi:hypothetical protein